MMSRTCKIGLVLAAGILGLGIGLHISMLKKNTITISFVGDVMLSRGVQGWIEDYGYEYPYEQVKQYFLEDDLTIGNLECPITDAHKAADKTKRFLFRADPQNAKALKKAGFDCMNLANNHTMDCLSQGLEDTMFYLRECGIDSVGAAKNAHSHKPYVFEKNGVRIGILAYSAFPPEGFFFQGEEVTVRYISTMDLSVLERDLETLESDFKIVYFHWGREYQPYISEQQEKLAKKAVECGADFVVGSHPHVLQEIGEYKGVPIYYSLGNFVFDRQIPSGTDKSMILQIIVGRDGIQKIREIPVEIRKGQPALIEQKEQRLTED